jgi:uncharacterized protein YecT (DUF1311 family)
MRAAFIGAAAAGLLLAAAPARADECANPMDQSTMNICADRDYRAADAVLNKTYRQALDKLDEDGRALLKESERAWIAFRDAECRYEAAPNQGGSIYPLIYSGCLTRLTKVRIAELKDGQQ